jgi:hypothetical protein
MVLVSVDKNKDRDWTTLSSHQTRTVSPLRLVTITCSVRSGLSSWDCTFKHYSKKPEHKQRQAPILPIPPPLQVPAPLPLVLAPVPVPKPMKPLKIPTPQASALPPPQLPYQNTANTWKEKKRPVPKNSNHQDIEMQDMTKGKGGYHLTSTIQEMADSDDVQSHILDMMITLPLRDILGMSADLQKRFAGLTKTQREYSQKVAAASYGHRECEDECGSDGESNSDVSTEEAYQDVTMTKSRLQLSYDTNEDVQEVLK